MLRQDTLTVLQKQLILRDKTGGLHGQQSQPKSVASHADHFRSICASIYTNIQYL